MAISHPIPVEILRQLLRLDAETGRLYWSPRPIAWFNGPSQLRAARTWNSRYAGTEAFTFTDPKDDYRKGRIFNRAYVAHRVVFAIAHGRWPTVYVDHENRNRQDNRVSNLREADEVENSCNNSYAAGVSQYRGVSWEGRRNRWVANCQVGGKRTQVGRFVNEIDAARAYDEFARRAHGEFANLNFPD